MQTLQKYIVSPQSSCLELLVIVEYSKYNLEILIREDINCNVK